MGLGDMRHTMGTGVEYLCLLGILTFHVKQNYMSVIHPTKVCWGLITQHILHKYQVSGKSERVIHFLC